jgi:hypothetical protein
VNRSGFDADFMVETSPAGSLELRVIGALVLVGRDVFEQAVQRAGVVYQSTHSIVAWSTSSMVSAGPARERAVTGDGFCLVEPIVVSARAVVGIADGADRAAIPS